MSSLRISIDPEQAPGISRELADEMLQRKGSVGRWRIVSGGLAIMVTPNADKAEEATCFEQWLWANASRLEGQAMDTKPDIGELWQHATTIMLSDEERDFFLALLENDDPPSEKALAAAARYNEGRREGSECPWQPSEE